MDVDTLTIGTTEYEDMLIGDSGDNMSSEEAAGALLPPAYNYTSLESIVTDVWDNAPSVRLHEVAVLTLSALVVGVHGLLGLVPRSLLSPRTAWLLLQATLALGCVYALGCVILAAHATLSRWFFRDAEDADEDEQAEPGAADDAVVESVVSSRIEKEERVKRWLDNLSTDPIREQMNLEACGEVRGRNMEADRSSADLLGDGQPLGQPIPMPANATPRCPRLLPLPQHSLPPLPATLPSTELASLTKEGRRALSLAYELSVAVRTQRAGAIRTTMSAPVSEGSGGLSLADAKDDWKLVRRGKEDFQQPEEPVQPLDPRPLDPRPLDPRGQALPPSDDDPQPPAAPRTPRLDDSHTPEASAPLTPTASATPNAAVSDNAVLNPSSSLLSFVRRFSGTRFLLRELANATDGLPIPGLVVPSLRLKDSRSLSLEPRPESRPDRPDPSHHRSALALPRVDAVHAVAKAEFQAAAPQREKVMKVFSKGLLSEGGSVEFPSAAAQAGQDAGRYADAVLGAAGFLAQDASGLPRATRTTATCTLENMTGEAAVYAAAPCPARSTLNLDMSSRSRVAADRATEGQDAAAYAVAVTTSRGLTANMSEEGIPRPARVPDLDDEHKSLFDLRKSLLTSIPEAAPPDEDFSHF
ncbi:uncharacterized protein LOC117643992 [Thrips palmi]|uniref:Uncharacterized protein LOC117643992 n=1 Tax=Thrips palmi TaxID=161013 RepID=A0A6P8ZLL6_THRPL|nr:uncharacterized protein LOC117643992 [Thrips palmi]